MAVVHQNGFSTAVRITLEVNGQVLRVAQVGRNWLQLKEIVPTPTGTPVRVVISVDGKPDIYPIVLHQGITGREVFFEDAAAAPAP